MFWQLKSAILVLLLTSAILAITAMFSEYWIVFPAQFAHFGILRGCNNVERCWNVLGTNHVQNLLLSVLAIGIVLPFPCSIMELRFIRSGGFGCYVVIGALSLLMAVLGFAAMVSGAVILPSLFNEPYYFSWSFALGWLSVLAAVASAAMSFYINRMEPPAVSDEEAGVAVDSGTAGPQDKFKNYFKRFSKILRPIET